MIYVKRRAKSMEKKNLETKRILIFLGVTFALTIGYSVGILYPMLEQQSVSTVTTANTQLFVALVMFFPAIGVLITRLITKEGFQNAWLHPHFKGNMKTYVLAYFGPGILTILGAVVYFLIFRGQFDADCGYLQTLMAMKNPEKINYSALMIAQGVQALLMGPILNFITCFGEEWGWRGYLLPKMAKKFSPIPMLLINGIIWGLWHAPLTAVGHNYGMGYPGFPFTGIAAMCIFCIVVGIFLTYVSMKTKSCIPAILAHGSLNSMGAIGTYFTKDGGNPFVGPAPMGIIGGIPFIIVAILICVFYFARKEND